MIEEIKNKKVEKQSARHKIQSDNRITEMFIRVNNLELVTERSRYM